VAKCVHNLALQAVREFHDLAGELEGGRDHGLRGDDGREHGYDERREEHARRHGSEEGVLVRVGVRRHVGRPAERGEQEARVRVEAPADLDGAHAEGVKVGEESLDARKGEADALADCRFSVLYRVPT